MISDLTHSTSGAAELEGPLILGAVQQELAAAQVVDVHTHLYMPSLGSLGFWGIDHLITYHYLEAELFRFSPICPEQYWALTKRQRADLIWKTLFVENTPISESTRGVIAVLHADFSEDAAARGRHFLGHLVRLQLDQRLVFLHRFAGFLQPFGDSRLGHGLAERRHHDIGHKLTQALR